jgi:TonB family protein
VRAALPTRAQAEPRELQLLLAWPNPLAVFASNLGDLLRGRVVPEQPSSSPPAHDFWRDIDLRSPLPRRGIFDSAMAHAALLGLLYAISIWPQSSTHLADPFTRRAMDAYTLSQYLPELHGAPSRVRLHRPPDPARGRQEILSLPQEPDNLHQTIVAPPRIRLKEDVALPNLVASSPAPPAPPIEAATPKLRLPAMIAEVIGPAVEAGSVHPRLRAPSLTPQVIEPAPELAQIKPRLALPAMQPRVIEPAPELNGLRGRRAGNLTALAPPAAAPIPEPPQLGDAPHASRQIIALNLHPAAILPPELPAGNRSGEFATSPAASPNGSGAPGAPTVRSGAVNAPSGIDVSAPAAAPATISAPDAPRPQLDSPPASQSLMARMRAPAISVPPRAAVRESPAARSEIENRIFGGRRSYTLAVNMPNLNTATGSWIIHFVERNPGGEAASLAAPEVVRKADPAYPGELVRERLHGTVVLTATIRADGSVGDIVVVKGLDPRIDRNAAEALSRWLFRPARRNGEAVELQAVITVPFRSTASGF